jgi:hypothetical protein
MLRFSLLLGTAAWIALWSAGCTSQVLLQTQSTTQPIVLPEPVDHPRVSGRSCNVWLFGLLDLGGADYAAAQAQALATGRTKVLVDVIASMEATWFLLFTERCYVVSGRPLRGLSAPPPPGLTRADVAPTPAPEIATAPRLGESESTIAATCGTLCTRAVLAVADVDEFDADDIVRSCVSRCRLPAESKYRGCLGKVRAATDLNICNRLPAGG